MPPPAPGQTAPGQTAGGQGSTCQPGTTGSTPGGVLGSGPSSSTGGTSHTTTPAPRPVVQPQVKAAQTPVQHPAAVSTAPAATGVLPFTGLELGIFLLIGAALVVGGLFLRASGRRKPTV